MHANTHTHTLSHSKHTQTLTHTHRERVEEAVWTAGSLPRLSIGVREVGARRWGGVPAVQETVVLEAAATEQRLVGVQGLGAHQWRYSWAAEKIL